MNLKLDYCCFCVDLKIGSLIFGYLHLMKDLIQIVASTIILNVNIPNSPYEYYLFYHYLNGNDPTITYSAIFLTFGLVTLLFTILLLNGLNQCKPKFVKAFLIYSGISTVIYSIICLILICEQGIFIMFVPGLLYLVVYIYFLLVIRSYLAKMDNKEIKSAIFSTPADPIVYLE